MAEPSQFTLGHKEILTLILKHLDIHEGHWMMGFSFGFAPSNFGPAPDQMNPGIAVIVGGMSITRIDPNLLSGDPLQQPPPSLTADAAVVNPRITRTSSIRKSDKN